MEVPKAANFVVGTFVIVEMATDGTEGLVYGMLTTVSDTNTLHWLNMLSVQAHNLGHPLGGAIANQVSFSPTWINTVYR